MAIQYPVDVVNTRWAILQISTGEIVARDRLWPRADGGEIVGQDQDFVYLLQRSTEAPEYDSRLFVLRGEEEIDVDANLLTRTWTAEARPTGERVAAAENVEAQRLSDHVRIERELIETRLMVGAILSYVVDAQSFPPKVRTMAQTYILKATKVWANRDRLTQLVAEINAGTVPDLDSGWATK